MHAVGAFRRGRRLCSLTLVATAVLWGGPALAGADEVERLIVGMESVSREAAARSEEVKSLEEEIRSGEEGLVSRVAAVERATGDASAAREILARQQGLVDGVAAARYRTLLVDPLTATLGAQSPQTAIDRAAYLDTLSRQSTDAVAALVEANAAAAREHGVAARARAEAEFRLGQRDRQRRVLREEQDELEAQITSIQAQVDALDPAARARWIAKNDPVDAAGLGDLLGTGESAGVVQAALSRLGAPYGWGATGPETFDCSGLIYWAYQQQGKTVPRTSQAQLAGGTPVERSALQPGDVVGYFPGATHVGLYIGQGMIVHASDYGIPVQVVPVDSMPWFGASRF